MSEWNAEIRGSFAKRAVKDLLQILPAGLELKLWREPENQYDPNAILVGFVPKELLGALPEGLELSDLEQVLGQHGLGTAEEWAEAAPEWPLGYVGKEWAQEVAPEMDQGASVSAKLGFSWGGRFMVEIKTGGQDG